MPATIANGTSKVGKAEVVIGRGLNNPNHYRQELPSSNRSHKGENKTDKYFGK